VDNSARGIPPCVDNSARGIPPSLGELGPFYLRLWEN